jgi:hypothetical protein
VNFKLSFLRDLTKCVLVGIYHNFPQNVLRLILGRWVPCEIGTEMVNFVGCNLCFSA